MGALRPQVACRKEDVMRFIALMGFMAASSTVMADQTPICIDGVLDDWGDVPVAVIDPSGDAFGGIDFTALSTTDDDLFFFLRIEAVDDFDLSENNALRIYLDTDADASLSTWPNTASAGNRNTVSTKPSGATGSAFENPSP